ncbi:hypothetical protein EJ08DRAFT_25624 [Tothia fuscella]|uniref:Uncharacterized protein n=1 Tax=Tothia fuscella TaxID=1048955 RepID=A0A9P4TTV3_9PEZI|nr:hypothetical protein EJ08DRAFT_25624 [Tothia fuscella]
MMGYISMADDEEKQSPLKKYQHLLPSFDSSINSLDRHLFLVNVSILFAFEDAEHLRVAVARTSDLAVNPNTGETAQRNLFYAALVIARYGPNESEHTTTSSARILAKGPAVPHFAPPHELPKPTGNHINKISSFSSSSVRQINEDGELSNAKWKAMSLLMARIENMVHTELQGVEAIEVWNSKAWKHAESNAQKEEEGNVKSGQGGGAVKSKNRQSSWFSKG